MAAHDPYRDRAMMHGQHRQSAAAETMVPPKVAVASPYASGQWASPPPTMQFLPPQTQLTCAGVEPTSPGTSPMAPPTASWPPRLGQPAAQAAPVPQRSSAPYQVQVAAQGLELARAQPQAHGAGNHNREAPPLAVAVANQALADPVMRQAIKQHAIVIGGHAADAAKYCGRQGLEVFQDYIQQGPQGVSVLCFVGGIATTLLGVMSVCNFFGTVMDPFHYILNIYVLAFGLATAVLEADTDRIGILMSPFHRLAEPVSRAQCWLHEECRLLTRLRGRGFFYLYQGTLLVTQCVFCLFFVCGLYCVAMGVVCILMSFGITPDIEGMMADSSAFGGVGGGGAPYTTLVSEAGATSQDDAQALRRSFQRGQAAFKQEKEHLTGKACRELWALQKQAVEGDCLEEMPQGVFNGSAKEQWRLWAKLRGIPEDEAKALFVEHLQREGISV